MTKKLFNNEIKALGQKMSLKSKVNFVGSASIKRSIYYTDYNLFESVENTSDSVIYNHFVSLFNVIKASPHAVISDFKLGHDERGVPLRWDYEDIHNGVNNGVSFGDALMQKGMIKIDVVAFVGYRFVEISEVYDIKKEGTPDRQDVIKDILTDYKELVHDNNYMKALKRLYSIIQLEDTNDKRLETIVTYFNSPIGLLYRCKSDLETILLILNYRKFNITDVKRSLQVIKEQISAFPVENIIEKISSMKNKGDMKQPLEKQIGKIKDFVNRDAKRFVAVHKL